MINVLVTGVGAIIGYGIIESLKMSRYEINITGLDIYEDAVGRKWVDRFIQAPMTSDPCYEGWVTSLITKENIDIVLPGIEQDANYFAMNMDSFKESTARFAVNSSELVKISSDKWLMHEYMFNKFPENCIHSEISRDFNYLKERLGLPFLLKTRSSYAGKGIYLVESEKDFEYRINKSGESLMAQKIIGSMDQEYTIGAFGNGKGDINSMIIFQRKLAQDGSTSKAKVIVDEDIKELIIRLSKEMKPKGPTNFQLRRHQNELKLLEVNPRISSSTSLRAKFGYNEAQQCIDYYYNDMQIEQPAIRLGQAQRYIADSIAYESINI